MTNDSVPHRWWEPVGGRPQWMALLIVFATIPGCLLNSVHSITMAPRTKPDGAHAIVVIGLGLDTPWPYTGFSLTMAEYSAEKHQITGNCFHYNRIEAAVPSAPAKVRYFAYEVPANIYVYLDLLTLVDAQRAPSPIGHAFMAPPGATVYFGDYIFVGDKIGEFRRNIDAARTGARKLLPHGAVLEPAESATAPDAHMFICTP